MQNKGIIRLFAILLAITCVYYFSFTYFSAKTEGDAKDYAQDYIKRPGVLKLADNFAKGDSARKRIFLDSMSVAVNDQYLDSVKSKPVYDMLITQYSYEECKEKSINLGLDLRGGMNVTLEISEADIIKKMSNNNTDIIFNKAIAAASDDHMHSTRDFVDLFGDEFQKLNPNGKLATYFQTIELKDFITYSSTNEEVLALIKSRANDAISTAQQTLRARIDKFGVAQPNIQLLPGTGRILIELPGISDKERVRKLLQGSADLEFWATYSAEEVASNMDLMNKTLASILANPLKDTASAKKDSTGGVAVKDTANAGSAGQNSIHNLLARTNTSDTTGKGATAKKEDSTKIVNGRQNPLFDLLGHQKLDGKEPELGYARSEDTAKIGAYLRIPQVRELFPAKSRFLWMRPKDVSKVSVNANDNSTKYSLIAIKITTPNGRAPLSGDIITDARPEYEQQGQGHPQIAMTMTPAAAIEWARITKENIGRCVAIVLDDIVYSAPVVQNEITGGRSSITGSFTPKEAADLCNILKAGRLPAPAHIVSESVVGPTLGKESIHSGLVSFIVALLLVLVFMAFYYNQAGRVADTAMLINVFFVLGVLSSLGAVLTLPGIAGIVLTIAMSVDANILIFERVREELALGKTLANAIKDGFGFAKYSIIDANATTFILGIILYAYGTGPIQGFATTLIIGIPTSLFTALFITRLMFERTLSRGKTISFDNTITRNAFRNIKINFVKRRHVYYVISGSILLGGLISFLYHGYDMGVDFKGGRTYVVRFNSAPTVESVAAALKPSFGGKAPEVTTYGTSEQVKITTTYKIADQSKTAESQVEAALNSGLTKLNNPYSIMSSELVGEAVSQDIKSKAIWSVLFACLLMFIYIFIRFRGWQYGLGAVVALFHDALMIMAAFTIFKGIVPFSLEINQDFIAAILTVMSYSMNDTVVVFDRIREYLTKRHKREIDKGENKTEVINYALNATLSRTINTSLSIFFVILAIFIFGGTTIRGFAFALLIGIVVGTYSSICIATPIVIDFDKKKKVEEPKTSKVVS
ncbi:MAG: protein translocase subunit SecDF [Bacteroidia bacterium]